MKAGLCLLVPLAVVATALCTSDAKSQTFLGPSPYASFADSPFNSVGFSYFHLEDFEDGSLNTPGVTANAGAVVAPGGSTDSVDGDDGAIDGSGTSGHSFLNSTSNSITFTFNAATLGSLPTHAGLVWTDVGNSSPNIGFDNVTFTATGSGGVNLGSIGPFLLGDGLVTGATAEDRFFGIVFSGGIESITISMTNSQDWEIDHLQYGAAATVPEPGVLSCLVPATIAGLFIRKRSKRG
jgi:hypothetical protein